MQNASRDYSDLFAGFDAHSLANAYFENVFHIISAHRPNLIHRYFSINCVICYYVLRLECREFKAVVIISSQKSLIVTVPVISTLGDIGEEGLMMIPCIIGNLSQLFIYSYIASRWGSEDGADGRNMTAAVGPKVRSNGEAVKAMNAGDIESAAV